MEMNYSVLVLKKAAFVDELNNLLHIHMDNDDEEHEETQVIVDYLENRIRQINEVIKLNFN